MNKDMHKFVFEELMDYAEIINGEQNDIHRFGNLFHCKPVFKWVLQSSVCPKAGAANSVILLQLFLVH